MNIDKKSRLHADMHLLLDDSIIGTFQTTFMYV